MQKNIDAAEYFGKIAQPAIAHKCFEMYGPVIPATEWQAKMKYGLAELLAVEYMELKKAYMAESPPSALAFRTRNLLELLVWTHHCLADEKHLRALFEDAGKDGIDLINTFEKWAKATGTDITSLNTDDARNRLISSADNHGIGNLSGKYQEVRDIAALYPSLNEYFKANFKFLSKFSHPTAITILGLSVDFATQLSSRFFNMGCFCFSVAIRRLALDFGIELLNPLKEK